MAKKPNSEPDDKEQSERFVETAKSLLTDEGGKKFSSTIKELLPEKKNRKQKR